jgi:hypothetical protein
MKDTLEVRKLPPVWFIRLLSSFREALISLTRKMYPANVVLSEHLQYYWILACLRVAAELNIAEILESGPKTIEEIGTLTDSHPGSLYRVMRALVSQGIFRRNKDGRFANSSLSKPLIDGKGSLRYVIRQHLGKINWSVFNDIMYTVKTGKDAFSYQKGQRIYEFLAEHKTESALFDRSMTDLTGFSIEPLLNSYDFSGYKTIADIGGGEGLLLANILYKHKELNGILLDLPLGLINSFDILHKYGVAERVQVIPADFLETMPAVADAYIVKNIIPNWSDEEGVKILSNIRRVLPDQGKILLIELVVEEGNRASYAKIIDIQMMVCMQDGKERTLKEFKTIIDNAGLRIEKIVPTIAPFMVIELMKR